MPHICSHDAVALLATVTVNPKPSHTNGRPSVLRTMRAASWPASAANSATKHAACTNQKAFMSWISLAVSAGQHSERH